MDAMTAGQRPTPFEVHESGKLLHGTKADLEVGDVLTPGQASNFEDGRQSNYVYVTGTLDAAAWGAELARGDGPGRIYIVEVDGELEDDPNLTDKKFPGNPTRSYRTREPVRIVGELTGWTGHSPDQQQAMRDGLATLIRERSQRDPRLERTNSAKRRKASVALCADDHPAQPQAFCSGARANRPASVTAPTFVVV